MSAPWTESVRQLCQFLERAQQRVQLLRDTDLKILGMASPSEAEGLLAQIIRDVSLHVGVSAAHLYFDAGDSWLRGPTTAPEAAMPVLGPEVFDPTWWQGDAPAARIVDSGERPSVAAAFPDAASALVAPLLGAEGRLIAVLVLESRSPGRASLFEDRSTREHVERVADQCSIIIRWASERQRAQTLSNMWADFLDEGLRPMPCLRKLAGHVPGFLPSIGPLRIPDDVGVQILFYEEGSDYLTIRATTGKEPDVTRVKVRDCIVGMLLGVPPRPQHILVDPQDYPALYKDYLGTPVQRYIRSELAVPVLLGSEIISIINLECEAANAFLMPHVEALREAARALAPLIGALQGRIAQASYVQTLVGSSFDAYLSTAASGLVHTVDNRCINMGIELSKIADRAPEADSEVQGGLKRLRRQVADLGQNVRSFSADVTGFATPRSCSARDLVQRTLSGLSRRELEDEGIVVTLQPGRDLRVFCSGLFCQYLHDVLDNSRYWLRQKMSRGWAGPAEIRIAVAEYEPSEAKQEVELNRQCLISVLDNGPGIDDDAKDHLTKRGYTMRDRGNGIGLWALKEYLQGIGGRVEFDSVKGESFEARIYLDLYRESVHAVTMGNVERQGRCNQC